jgi:hypothetical protein
MIVEAAARLHSFADAAFALHLSGVSISSRHVQRIALEIGAELIQQRDHKVLLRRRRQLPVVVAAIPAVVAVEVDGGRLRTRASDRGPGVHDKQNKEDKIACLITLQSEPSEIDPQPQPPESLLVPRRVQRLVQQMHGKSGDVPQEDEEQEDTATASQSDQSDGPDRTKPRKLVRTCVASMTDSHSFGPMVAAEAQQRGFYQAKRRAYLADGAAYNWEIHRGYFSDFEAIVDFLHVLCYVYLAAWAVGTDEEQKWSGYVVWMRACWQGRVKEVIEELKSWQRRIGEPPEEEELEAKDPRVLVKEALTYLQNNQRRMDYPRYRKQGLPCTSSLAESLVGQFNARVKSSEKFWNRGQAAEAILQLRAAILSEDDRLTRFFAQRPGNPYRCRNST